MTIEVTLTKGYKKFKPYVLRLSTWKMCTCIFVIPSSPLTAVTPRPDIIYVFQ